MSATLFAPAARRRIAPLVLGLGLAAAGSGRALASAPQGPDPWEGANRVFYKIEGGLDRALIRPLAVFYRHAAPRPVRDGLRRFVANLGEPGVAVNDFLQGRGARGARTVVRFAVNSTFGVGGLFDPSAQGGLPHHDNDFGLTLARYGVKTGPYLYLPLVGPTNLRDGAASVVTMALNPLTYTAYPGQAGVAAATTTTSGLDARGAADAQLKALNSSAVDPYATLRAYAQQDREAQVRGGVVEIETLPDFDEDPAPAPVKADPPPSAPGGR
jgi:phospholipid-binding lipoprotein MlaA